MPTDLFEQHNVAVDLFETNGIKPEKKRRGKSPPSFMQGLGDIFQGGGQLLSEIVPEPVERGLNSFNNWLVDKGIPLQRMPEGGMDELVRNREQEYQQARADAGETGFDYGRLAGNVANPVNLLAAARLPQAATLLGRVGTGAGYGAAYGSVMPVTEGDFSAEKTKQVVSGGVGGAVLPPLTSGVARAVKPYVSPALDKIKSIGVTPTLGQSLGPTARRIEEGMSSVPFLGDIIRSARGRSLLDFNKGVANEILKPIGRTLPDGVEPGSPSIAAAHSIVSKAYDQLLPQLKGKLDRELINELNGIKNLGRSLPKEQKRQLLNILDDNLYSRFTSSGLASGTTIKEMKTNFGKLARDYTTEKAGPDQRRLGDAFREIQDALRRMILRQNPQHGDKLRPLEKSWATLMTVSKANKAALANGGIFTPNQLMNAVKSGKSGVTLAYGNNDIQKIAAAGHQLIPNKLPDSGTPLRSLLSLGLLGGSHMIHPMAPYAGAAAAIPYTRLGQRMTNSLLNDRPNILGKDVFGGLADMTRRSAIPLAPSGMPLIYSPIEGP